ncbi:zinc finger protein, putative [Ixodes scapularis]|uniref:Zinc finger protein, putative n=1 Tax=Ixodes scapularis TaxID=6945 RepID=B7Q3S8_IXOSC|nr:zinc finger protein, putative [Ixodes scapularis]|eukprot:XP_002411376.1 zinc finger protein, putative [Ixodes scapularis]
MCSLADLNPRSTARGGLVAPPRCRKQPGKPERSRFQCSYCEYRSEYKCYVVAHERIHTGERPYKCPLCSKAFTFKHHVTTHLRCHTGEKPFRCSMCPRSFAQKSNLNQHLLIHRNNVR